MVGGPRTALRGRGGKLIPSICPGLLQLGRWRLAHSHLLAQGSVSLEGRGAHSHPPAKAPPQRGGARVWFHRAVGEARDNGSAKEQSTGKRARTQGKSSEKERQVVPQLLRGEGSMVLRRTVCGRRPWSEALAGGGPSIPLPVQTQENQTSSSSSSSALASVGPSCAGTPSGISADSSIAADWSEEAACGGTPPA